MTRRTRLSTAELDRAVREAERSAYAHYGLEPEEKLVTLDVGFGRVGVRLLVFGTPGGDQPPVLLMHGIASVTVLAAPLLAHLRDRYVIAIDWPGHGLSDEGLLPLGISIRRHAAMTIESLLDLLDLPEVDVVGHSMGAQFGLYASLDLGDRIRRLVLLGAPGAGFLGVRPVLAMKLIAIPWLGMRLLSLPLSEKAFERNNERVLGPGALKDLPPDLVLAARLLASRTVNASSIAAFFRAVIKRSSIRDGVAVPLDELGRLRQPTLLAWGDDDVFLTPLAGARSVVAIRDAHLIRVPHAGHAPWLTSTERVGHAVAAHLRTAAALPDAASGTGAIPALQ